MSHRFVRSYLNEHVKCITRVRTANMIVDGQIIGTLSEESNDAEEVSWVIRPNYNADPKLLGIIPGIDLDLHLDEYVRSFEPYIVEERTLDDDRPDLPKRLKKLGMRWNDKFEYMCRTHGICGNNPIRIERIVG